MNSQFSSDNQQVETTQANAATNQYALQDTFSKKARTFFSLKWVKVLLNFIIVLVGIPIMFFFFMIKSLVQTLNITISTSSENITALLVFRTILSDWLGLLFLFAAGSIFLSRKKFKITIPISIQILWFLFFILNFSMTTFTALSYDRKFKIIHYDRQNTYHFGMSSNDFSNTSYVRVTLPVNMQNVKSYYLNKFPRLKEGPSDHGINLILQEKNNSRPSFTLYIDPVDDKDTEVFCCSL